MTQTVVGIFDDPRAAANAFERLMADGFTHSDVDMTDRSELNYDETGLREDRKHSNDDFGDRVSRFFRNLFDDEDDAERYTSAARTGTVISVYADSSDKAERAAMVLDQSGAIDVDERFKERQAATSPGMSNERRDMTDDTNRSIPVIEEDMQVGKREVETGGMRIRSRIIDRPVEESLRLRHERVTVERNPANRPATEADLNAFREGEVEVRERAEVPVVKKEARVVEEVNVRKDIEEREEIVRDTVRKTDVEVDPIEGDSDAIGNKSRSKRKT